MDISTLTPDAIVELLGKHVQNQLPAKQALALAIRNRWRRQQLPAEIRDRIKKQNIMFKGPTGSGKTALLRAVEKELGWPVHFVDITQYSETGYKGKDLEEIISNFVSKYSDKALPQWYLNEKKRVEANAKLPPKEMPKVKTDEPKEDIPALADRPTTEVAELVIRSWVISLYALDALPCDADLSTNPLVTDGRDCATLYDFFKETLTEDKETLAYALLNMRAAEHRRGKPYPNLSDMSTDERLEAAKEFKALPDHPTVSDLIYASTDVHCTCESMMDYKDEITPILSSMPISRCIDVFQKTSADALSNMPYAFTLWYLWASVMYDNLIRCGAWKPLSNPRRIGGKSLNVKARKFLSEFLGIPAKDTHELKMLNDVWYKYAFSDTTPEGKTCSYFENTIEMAIECQGRLITSSSITSPVQPNVYYFTDAIGGDAEKPWLYEKWSEQLGEKIRPIRSVIKSSSTDYKVKHEHSKVWEDLKGCITKLFTALKSLDSSLLHRFTATRYISKEVRERHSKPWNLQNSGMSEYMKSVYASIGSGAGVGVGGQTREEVIEYIQDYGICFIDEIDKIGSDPNTSSMITRDGVQRGLLALVEGTEYPIKSESRLSDGVEYVFDTTRLMFVAAGAFSVMPVECLIPELRGRFPIVADIHPLLVEDYQHILRMESSSVHSAIALMGVEDVAVVVTDDGYEAMAMVCESMNQRTNLGARRLESIVDDVFLRPMMNPLPFKDGLVIDRKFVEAIEHFTFLKEKAEPVEERILITE